MTMGSVLDIPICGDHHLVVALAPTRELRPFSLEAVQIEKDHP